MKTLKWTRLAVAVSGLLSSSTAFSYDVDRISVMALKDLSGHVVQKSRRPSTRTAFDAIVRPVAANNTLEQDAAWIPARLLADPANQDEVRALFSNGIPLLITQEADEHYAAKIGAMFGASMNVSAAFYYRDQDGALQILATETLHATADDRAKLDRAAEVLAERRSLVRTQLEQEPPMAIPTEVPRFEVLATQLYPGGAAITVFGTATRNSTRSSDVKVVTMKTRYVAPALRYEFRGGAAPSLIIPSKYRFTQGIQAFNAIPALVDRYPLADSRTDITLAEQKTTSTNYGFSLSPELQRGLQGKVRSSTSKLAFSLEFAKNFSESKSVSMTLKDYFINTSAEDGLILRAHWDVTLAPLISGKNDYFGDAFATTPTKVTPLMRGIESEVFSSWVLPGAFEDWIRLTSTYQIGYTQFGAPAMPQGAGTDRLDEVTAVSIDSKTPFLSREITALIRSTSNNGCLTADPDTDIIGLQPCDAALDNYAQQWNLDSESRYRNRMDGRCMQVSARDSLRLVPCSLVSSQQFQWIGERIHSMRDGDNRRLRLYSDGQDVRFESTAKETLPPNPFHELLAPWSSYPDAPQSGDIIPDVLPRVPRAIPEEWIKQYGAVPPNERWDVVVLRQGV